MNSVYLDNTYRSALQSCPRKYYLSRILGLKPEKGSSALRYGSTWHAFIEGYYTHIKEHGWSDNGGAIQTAAKYGKAVWEHETSLQDFYEDDYRTLQNCGNSFLEYVTTFSFDKQSLEVVDTEQVFRHNMSLTDEEKEKLIYLRDIDVYFTGRLDVQVKLSGVPWIMEMKSTGQYLKTQIARLNRSPQILGYTYAGKHALKYSTEGTLVSIHQLTSRRKKDGDWGKKVIDFARVPQIFTDKDLSNWRESFLCSANLLQYYKKANIWPMMFDSCYQFGACQFSRICERDVSLEELAEYTPEGFVVNKKDILTFSTKDIIGENNAKC